MAIVNDCQPYESACIASPAAVSPFNTLGDTHPSVWNRHVLQDHMTLPSTRTYHAVLITVVMARGQHSIWALGPDRCGDLTNQVAPTDVFVACYPTDDPVIWLC